MRSPWAQDQSSLGACDDRHRVGVGHDVRPSEIHHAALEEGEHETGGAGDRRHHFRAGAYQVGGPIGRVWYYPKHRELWVGLPLTITKKNLDQYVNTF